ncbi:MAG: FtsX-like permease family protein [Alphaproteobacteria bacterium]|nr:FtsX-like permease family protein [Alphaproteobacteria bacterium]
MSALDAKLMRDLWRMRGQVLAIALVIASGMGVLVMSLSAMEALDETTAAYYERYRFPHVFAEVTRAPETMVERIANLPGVQSVESRIVDYAPVRLDGFTEPVTGVVTSIPEHAEPLHSRLVLRAGRLPTGRSAQEVAVGSRFADAHGLTLGDRLTLILNGRKTETRVVGIAFSPEFVHAVGPGTLIPDDKRFAVLWMTRPPLAAAYDMEGAFNSVTLRLRRDARVEQMVDRLDGMLARYGGIGAYGRKDQASNWVLMNEIEQLRSMSVILPAAFLAVAAFLTNMVLARLIAVERSEIGLLKAFGYGSTAVAWHYLKLVLAIGALGAVLGTLFGYFFGRWVTELYAASFAFPFLYFAPSPQPFAVGALVHVGAAALGALGAVRRAVALAPAEAMQPPPPASFQRGVLASRVFGWLDQETRILLRHIARWPLRAMLTTTGIGVAIGLIVVALQWRDGTDELIRVAYHDAQRHDVAVGLTEALDRSVLADAAAWPGVLAVEGGRNVAVRFRHGHRFRRTAITGIDPDARLSPIHDVSGAVIEVPDAGLVIGTVLAERLKISVGDRVVVEVLEGRRPVAVLPVVGLVEVYLGTPIFLHQDALARLLDEAVTTDTLYLRLDPLKEAAFFEALQETPAVAGATLKRVAVGLFEETLGDIILIYTGIFTAFACALAVGVVFNSARIALSERGREMATLRVLGFTQGEVAYVLLGEIALLTLLALPIGALAGYGLAALMATSFETELFRLPLAIRPASYGLAALIGLAAAAFSMALVRDQVARLDLIAVLKTRE